MATSSLIRLLVVVIILIALAISSGLAWGTIPGPDNAPQAIESIPLPSLGQE